MAESPPVQLDADGQDDRTVRLSIAAEQLERVLETIDLDRESDAAEAVVDAVAATERARSLAVESAEPDPGPYRDGRVR